MHEWGADTVGIQEARDRHDSQLSGHYFEVFAAAAANRIRVTSSSSRHILAVIRCPSLGHAPVQDEQGKQEMWRREITAMAQGRPQPRADLVALLDANGRVGSISSVAVGAVEPQEEDGRELLHDFIRKCDVMGANTFDGTGRCTWIEYVVCPQRWLPMLHREGAADFSLAIADKEDHRPVFAKFCFARRV